MGTRNQQKEGEPYEWMTFKEANTVISSLRFALADVNICIPHKVPDTGLDTEIEWRLMGFYSENRSEYITTELACIAESITLVPISSRPNDLYNAKHILE